jgi:prohibitin 2
MAQNKMNDFVNRFGKAPKGVGVGMKLLAAAGAAAYGVSQSIYTGKSV